MKKLKNKKEIFEVNDKKDILLNFMPKISTLLLQAWARRMGSFFLICWRESGRVRTIVRDDGIG